MISQSHRRKNWFFFFTILACWLAILCKCTISTKLWSNCSWNVQSGVNNQPHSRHRKNSVHMYLHTWNIVCMTTVRGRFPEYSVTLKTLRPHLFTSSSSWWKAKENKFKSVTWKVWKGFKTEGSIPQLEALYMQYGTLCQCHHCSSNKEQMVCRRMPWINYHWARKIKKKCSAKNIRNLIKNSYQDRQQRTLKTDSKF